MGISLLFKKNWNQLSGKWHKQQQQAKTDEKYNILAIFIIQCFWGSWLPTFLCHPAPWYLLFTAPTMV